MKVLLLAALLAVALLPTHDGAHNGFVYYKSESTKGMDKTCHYNRGDGEATLHVKIYERCPFQIYV